MVVTAHGQDLDLLVGGSGELHCLALKAFDTGSVEFPQETHDASLLAGTG